MKEFTPEWAEPITEIPAAKIRDTARAMAEAKPAVALHPGRHVTWYGDDTQRARAMAILTALLGAGDARAAYFCRPIEAGKYSAARLSRIERGRADGAGNAVSVGLRRIQGVTNGSGRCHACRQAVSHQGAGWYTDRTFWRAFRSGRTRWRPSSNWSSWWSSTSCPMEQIELRRPGAAGGDLPGALRHAADCHEREAALHRHSAACGRAAVRIEAGLVDCPADGAALGLAKPTSRGKTRKNISRSCSHWAST